MRTPISLDYQNLNSYHIPSLLKLCKADFVLVLIYYAKRKVHGELQIIS